MEMAWDWTLWGVVISALILVNMTGVFLTALQLPGTWLMVLGTAIIAWLHGMAWRDTLITYWTPITLLVLAVVGEVIETAASAAFAGKAGASKRAMIMAIGGGLVGALVGTFALAFIPILGTLIGAAIGAGVGSLLGDKWAGRQWGPAWKAGRGAAVGRFWGALGKLCVAVIMLGVVIGALLWP
jgi:uncharacterized protein YqgC (DUF456 family)